MEHVKMTYLYTDLMVAFLITHYIVTSYVLQDALQYYRHTSIYNWSLRLRLYDQISLWFPVSPMRAVKNMRPCCDFIQQKPSILSEVYPTLFFLFMFSEPLWKASDLLPTLSALLYQFCLLWSLYVCHHAIFHGLKHKQCTVKPCLGSEILLT
jgi:hypothetical protein